MILIGLYYLPLLKQIKEAASSLPRNFYDYSSNTYLQLHNNEFSSYMQAPFVTDNLVQTNMLVED